MTDADSQITPNSVVSLRPINNDNLWSVLKLKVAPAQEGFVASNAVSLAQAHFNKDVVPRYLRRRDCYRLFDVV